MVLSVLCLLSVFHYKFSSPLNVFAYRSWINLIIVVRSISLANEWLVDFCCKCNLSPGVWRSPVCELYSIVFWTLTYVKKFSDAFWHSILLYEICTHENKFKSKLLENMPQSPRDGLRNHVDMPSSSASFLSRKLT